MGDPRKLKRKYEKPKHPWIYSNLEKERNLMKAYGLKNKKEIWKAESKIRKYRKQARELIGIPAEEREKKQGKFLEKLKSQGILKEQEELDDVLSLKTKDYLERRLETQAYKKGYGRTPKQARQLITHGHIKVNGRRATKPSRIIKKSEEGTINWYGKPVEQAKAEKTPEEIIEEAKEKGQIKEKPKKKKETKQEKTKEQEEINYEKLAKENISDIKEKSKSLKLDYKKLLTAEKQNKDRKTMKKWIEKKIGE